MKLLDQMVKIGLKELKSKIPVSLSPEKQFVNAIAGGLALMVASDGDIEEDETVSAVEFLMGLDCVSDLSMQDESVAFYNKYIEQLESVLNNKVRFTTEKYKIIGDIKLVNTLDSSYKDKLIDMLNIFTSDGGANRNEIEMKADIMKVIV